MPAAAVPAIIMGASALGSAGLGMYGQSQANKAASGSADDAMAIWRQTAFPSPWAAKSLKKSLRNQLGAARTGAYGNMFNQMSTRGFGSGSGAIMGGAQNIERDYMRNLGQGILDINKWKYTPMWSPPGQGYPTSQQSPMGYGAQNMSGMMDTALGYYMMNQMMNNQQPNYPTNTTWSNAAFSNIPNYEPGPY